jgi:tetratricopeptide (TPR) repeat protein
MKQVTSAMTFIVLGGVFAGVALWGGGGRPSDLNRASVLIEVPGANDRLDRVLKLVRNLNAGEHAAARAEFERMMSNPQSPLDAVDGRRMMAMSLRQSGDGPMADIFLDDALKALAAVDEQDAVKSAMKRTILMDRADLAAFTLGDSERAILLYDEVVSADPSNPASLIAARNAAFLHAKIGKFAAAIERVDALLASPAASTMSQADRTELLASQASWFTALGDRGQAYSHYLAIWTARTADSLTVANAGAMCVSVIPAQTRCKELLSLAEDVLAMVDRLKVSGAAHGSPLAEIVSCEQQVAASIISAEGCASAATVQAARVRLSSAAAGRQ